MNLVELLNLSALALALFVVIIILNLLLQRTVDRTSRGLFLKLGIFLLFSLLVFIDSYVLAFLGESESFSKSINMGVNSLWWITLTLLVNEALTFFIWDRLLYNKGITVSKLLRDLITLVLIVITIACIFYFVLNKSVIGLFTASGVMAIILGYSAQATLGEAFAGIGLNITKQFDHGDWIGLSGVHGKVVDINWRFVNLLTLDGNYLSIPNSQIAKEKITNYSRPNPIHGITIKVPVSNTLSPEVAKKLLVTAASQSFKTATNPAPVATLIDYQASNNNHQYQLSYYTSEQNESLSTDEILSIFWYQCHRALELHNETKSRHCSHEDLQIFLKKMDVFNSLNDEELELLASQCTQRIYGPPERILAQGQANESLFLIYQGGVDVYIKTPENQNIKVASIKEGVYFGEMSLLTGDPAGASIVVNTESLIIEVSHDIMATLFDKRPELVEKISEVIVQRKLHNESVKESLKKNLVKETKSLISQLADRIKGFFKRH